MLVLGREVDEAVRIGDDIRIVVCAILPNGTVRLGFEAPLHVVIAREELIVGPRRPMRLETAAERVKP